MGMAFPAITAHSVSYLTDMGIDPVTAAAVMGASIFMRFPTQIISGFFADRIPKKYMRYLVMLGMAIAALGMFIFTRVSSLYSAWAFAIVFGLGNGTFLGIEAQLRGRYWGRKAYATIGGIIFPFMLIPGIIAPVYAGWIYDTTGSYTTAFNMILLMSILAVIVMFFANPPKPPKKVSHISDIF
jgi:MFS family permease